MNLSLFSPIVDTSKMHPSFKGVCDSIGHRGARKLMEEMFAEMPNPDKNFIEQFQTTGFDSRTFELGLFSYFNNYGYKLERQHEQPDFIVFDGKMKVAIEATTSSPPENLRFKNTIPHMEKLTLNEIQYRNDEELPIRLGTALFSKLNKKYWELPHCKDIPLVIAIQPFHEAGSLTYTSISVFNYLFGIRTNSTMTNEGEIIVRNEVVKEHRSGKKVIPSGFFSQPDVENISAVIFSNSLTVSKFTRMSYQKGYFREGLKIKRAGSYYPEDDQIFSAPTYEYYLDDSDAHVETWAESLVVFLNPNAKHPLPKDFFKDVSYAGFQDGEFVNVVCGFYPFTSATLVEIDKNKILD